MFRFRFAKSSKRALLSAGSILTGALFIISKPLVRLEGHEITSSDVPAASVKLSAEARNYIKTIDCDDYHTYKLEKLMSADQRRVLNRISSHDEDLGSSVTFRSVWQASSLYEKYKHNNGSCVLFWKNYVRLSDLMLVKFQSTLDRGTCWAQAPVVTQHYVVTINRNEDVNVGTVEVPSLVRHVINSCSKLEDFIGAKYEGGNSWHTLLSICELRNSSDWLTKKPERGNTDKAVWCEQVMERIRVQPALISTFDIAPKFRAKDDKVSFTEEDCLDVMEHCTVTTPSHSMVLVGMRRDEAGEYWFLAQNWWEDKPFVEFTYEYLVAVGGQFTFINKQIKTVPQVGDMSITFAKALSTAVDRGEGPAMREK